MPDGAPNHGDRASLRKFGDMLSLDDPHTKSLEFQRLVAKHLYVRSGRFYVTTDLARRYRDEKLSERAEAPRPYGPGSPFAR